MMRKIKEEGRKEKTVKELRKNAREGRRKDGKMK
jgi:hypothetical protein